jgi:TP901-1 family phage major tail protein
MTTAVSGRYMLLKVATVGSPATFTAVAALKDTNYSIKEAEVDVTTKDDSGKRQLMAGNVLASVEAGGTGVFTNVTQLATIRAAALAGTHLNWQVYVADTEASSGGQTVTGAFRIVSFEEAGAHDSEMNYSIQLKSAGTITLA